MAITVGCAGRRGPASSAQRASAGSIITSSTVAPTTVAATTVPPITVPPAPERNGKARFAVGTIARDFVDSRRQRTLHTIVYYPAQGQAGQAGRDPVNAAFSLVIMAHGYLLPADGYERVLAAVTAAGYIVAAPAFPHTSPATDGTRTNIVNQPGDMSFVADSVIDLAAHETQVLPQIANPTRVAAMGHSDGGLTVSAWAYDNSFRDRRVAAAVVMTGGIGLFPGTYFGGDSPPLLAIHATADEVNPYSASVNLFGAVPAGIPRFLLTVEGGSHLGPYMFDTALPEIGQVVVDFLDGYLVDDPGGRQRLTADSNSAGRLTVQGA